MVRRSAGHLLPKEAARPVAVEGMRFAAAASAGEASRRDQISSNFKIYALGDLSLSAYEPATEIVFQDHAGEGDLE
jgi:hypothetical protein